VARVDLFSQRGRCGGPLVVSTADASEAFFAMAVHEASSELPALPSILRWPSLLPLLPHWTLRWLRCPQTERWCGLSKVGHEGQRQRETETDRDRERERQKERETERERERETERDRERQRDRERERERERDRERQRETERERDRDRERQRESERQRQREGERVRDRENRAVKSEIEDLVQVESMNRRLCLRFLLWLFGKGLVLISADPWLL
jgi:hypothetical protein